MSIPQTSSEFEQAFLDLTKSGKFFDVDFFKKDGTLRKMNARRGVKKHVKGVGMAYDPGTRGMVGVWDSKIKEGGDKAYRLITLSQITRFQIGQQEFIRPE